MEAAIVARVSNDNGGTSTSPAEQRDSCVKTVHEQGWRIAGEFIESDLSASRFALKDRPEWKRLLETVESGALGVVVMWEPSRGSRELETWAHFLNLCRKHNVLIHVFTHHRTYDVRIAREWRTLAEDGVDAAYESEKISERSLRAASSRKEAGKPLGRAPYAYRRTYDPHSGRMTGQVPDGNAPRVRQLITDIANGVPVSKAARTAGIRHQHALWIARNPAYTGRRPGPDGVLVEAEWEPVVAEDIFWMAQAVLDGHRGARQRPGSYRSLLSRLATCGKCGEIIISDGKAGYRCKKGCVAYRDREDADQNVMWKLLNELEQPDVLERYAPADPGEADAAKAEAARIERELFAAAESYGQPGGIGIGTLEAIEARLRPALAQAQDRVRTVSVPPALARFTGRYARSNAAYQIWLDMPLAAQRSLIRELADVKINGRNHPHRVEVILK